MRDNTVCKRGEREWRLRGMELRRGFRERERERWSQMGRLKGELRGPLVEEDGDAGALCESRPQRGCTPLGEQLTEGL